MADVIPPQDAGLNTCPRWTSWYSLPISLACRGLWMAVHASVVSATPHHLVSSANFHPQAGLWRKAIELLYQRINEDKGISFRSNHSAAYTVSFHVLGTMFHIFGNSCCYYSCWRICNMTGKDIIAHVILTECCVYSKIALSPLTDEGCSFSAPPPPLFRSVAEVWWWFLEWAERSVCCPSCPIAVPGMVPAGEASSSPAARCPCCTEYNQLCSKSSIQMEDLQANASVCSCLLSYCLVEFSVN